jgi:hypothetical protein
MSKASKRLLLALFVAAFFPPALQARDSCNPKGPDVCEMARELANEMSEKFPIRHSKYLTSQAAFASDNIYTQLLMLEYNRAFLDEVLTLMKETDDQMIDEMRKGIRNNFCATGGGTELFIDSGGVLRMIYIFKDGSVYTTITIALCD